MMNNILVTGAAGFIGYHLCRSLLRRGDRILGLDNLNDYYDPNLKKARLAQIGSPENFRFVQANIADRKRIEELFGQERFNFVVHLAAQAGVRYSLVNPHAYVDSNVSGFLNILEGCRHTGVDHLVFASSSSVYGSNKKMPFSIHDNVDHPVSLYGASKKANELMAHSYASLFDLPCTGLRFFTVYGPWGRPDMALFLFTSSIIKGETIKVFNHGRMKRDFTYIDDIVEGVVRVMDRIPQADPHWKGETPDPGTSHAPYRLYNIGNHQPVELLRFIEVIEKCLGKKAKMDLMEIQPGDVRETYADVQDLIRDVDFQPSTPIEVGISKFVSWYKEYFRIEPE